MSISTKNALRALEKQLYAYNYAQALMSCDEATAAPPCSEAGRAEAAEVLSRAAFALLVNDDTAALLRQAAAETDLDPQLAAEVRELQRRYDEIARIPADEYAAFTRLVQQAIPAWGRAKRANDFAAFAPYLESIVDARRKQAAYFAPERHPYEVLLDRYERGLTIATCDRFFAELRETILPLLDQIRSHGTPVRTDFLDNDWPLPAQQALALSLIHI